MYICSLTPLCRYLAKLASRHQLPQNGFSDMLFTSLSRHPRISPSPRDETVTTHVNCTRYLAISPCWVGTGQYLARGSGVSVSAAGCDDPPAQQLFPITCTASVPSLPLTPPLPLPMALSLSLYLPVATNTAHQRRDSVCDDSSVILAVLCVRWCIKTREILLFIERRRW